MKLVVNDITVSYSDAGKKRAKAIILIHGFPLNKSMWNKQTKVLEDKYRVITYDIRGHGLTDAGNAEFTIELFARDLLSFMDRMDIERTVLCGLSMGGYIALKAIGRYPDRFDALILSDTNCIADSSEAKEKRMKAIENIRNAGSEKYADDSIKNLFAPGSFITGNAAISAVREMIVKTSEQSLFKTLHALAEREETLSQLHSIEFPVLILVGSEDKITPWADAKVMHENIKDSLLQVIQHAGHLSNMENPEDFNNQLVNFMAAVYKQTIQLNSDHRK